jgi:Cu(I)-responsive transcriptional regulator
MNIGEASRRCGLSSRTIRYYEQVGLVSPRRGTSGYRRYAGRDVSKLAFLRRARDLGFSLEQCRQLLELYDDEHRASADVLRIAQTHLEEIERKLEDLRRLRGTLTRLADACHGDERPECEILDELAGRPGRAE